MTFVRRHLHLWAVATLSLQIGLAGLVAVGVCCAGDPDGAHERSAVECPMHQVVTATATTTEHGHHEMAAPAAPSSAEPQQVARMTCDCGSDSALASGPAALVSDPLTLSIAAADVLVGSAERPQLVGRAFSPPSPPPRPHDVS